MQRLIFFLFLVAIKSDPNVNYALVPNNFLADDLPGSIPTLQSYNYIVPNIARQVFGGAFTMLDAIAKCWHNAFGPFTGLANKYSTSDINDPLVCGAKNKSVMTAVAFYVIATNQYPQEFIPLSFFLTSIGIPVDLTSISQTLPSSGLSDYQIGLASGRAAITFYNQDGANSLGTEGNETHPPYWDYTNYANFLENTAFSFKNCNQWQPLILTDALTTGFKIQNPLTPQWRFVFNMYNNSMNSFVTNFPRIYANCQTGGHKWKDKVNAYENQTYEVAARLAALNDSSKMAAEHFDDKLEIFLKPWILLRNTVPGPYSNQTPWTIDDDAVLLAVGDAAGMAGAVASWSVKYYTRSVRPLNAFHNVFAEENFTSWGGPYQGTQIVLGRNIQTYLSQQGHPSYPSGTTCFAEALIGSFKNVTGVDVLPQPLVISFSAGSSKIEPAIPSFFGYPGKVGTPSTDINITFNSLSQYAYEAGESRLNSGVHFAKDVESARMFCPTIGGVVSQKVLAFVYGTTSTLLNPNDRDHFSVVDPLLSINWFE